MTTDADGRVRMEFVLPVRGLIGYRGQLLTDTRGTALLHQIGEGYGPWAGEVTHRTNGVLVSDRHGHLERLRPVQPPGALGAAHRLRRRRLRGHDRRRERPLRRHGRQRDQGEEAHQHPDPLPRRGAAPDAAASADAGERRSSSSAPTSWSRSRRQRSACASDCSPGTTGGGSAAATTTSQRSNAGRDREPGRTSVWPAITVDAPSPLSPGSAGS